MKYVRYMCVGIFAIGLIMIALANRGAVELRVWPEDMAGLVAVDPSITLPLFVVIFISIMAGLIVGFVWEWLREATDRAKISLQAKEIKSLRNEVQNLKGEKHQGKDEVLALLEEAS